MNTNKNRNYSGLIAAAALIAGAAHYTTPSPFEIPLALKDGTIFPSDKSTRRKIRKLVSKGQVRREELPLDATSNNLLFSYLRPMQEHEITGTYTGVPFNLATAPVIAPSIEKVGTASENTAVRKVAKRKSPPKVEPTVTKVESAPKAKTPKVTAKKSPKASKTIG